jgi:hypothetical protein
MLRLTNLANKYQRRTLRVLYGNTQAYPYDAQLDPSFDRTAGALAGSLAITGAKSAILPGMVAVKLAGEVATVSDTWDDERAFGLFANFVGGELSDIPSDFDRVGVWRGVGSVYELLAPAFDDTNVATYLSSEDGTGPGEIYLNSGSKGQLTAASNADYNSSAGAPTARLMKSLSANAIVVELLV